MPSRYATQILLVSSVHGVVCHIERGLSTGNRKQLESVSRCSLILILKVGVSGTPLVEISHTLVTWSMCFATGAQGSSCSAAIPKVWIPSGIPIREIYQSILCSIDLFCVTIHFLIAFRTWSRKHIRALWSLRNLSIWIWCFSPSYPPTFLKTVRIRSFKDHGIDFFRFHGPQHSFVPKNTRQNEFYAIRCHDDCRAMKIEFFLIGQ